MANKWAGMTDVKLANEVRTLKYDGNAFAEIEDRTGMDLMAIATGDLSFKQLRTVLWAGLLWSDPTYLDTGQAEKNERQVMAGIKDEDLIDALAAVRIGIELALLGNGKNAESGSNNSPKKRRRNHRRKPNPGTGSKSAS